MFIVADAEGFRRSFYFLSLFDFFDDFPNRLLFRRPEAPSIVPFLSAEFLKLKFFSGSAPAEEISAFIQERM